MKNMFKTVLNYILVGIVISFVGYYISCGIPGGEWSLLYMMFLCIVIVTCTGIICHKLNEIISELHKNDNSETNEKPNEDNDE